MKPRPTGETHFVHIVVGEPRHENQKGWRTRCGRNRVGFPVNRPRWTVVTSAWELRFIQDTYGGRLCRSCEKSAIKEFGPK